MHLRITSPANPRIKNVLKLREGSERNKSGLTIVEGVREISRALEAQISFKEIYICPELFNEREGAEIFKKLRTRKIPFNETTQSVFLKISYGDRREGILAVCQPPKLTLKSLAGRNPSFFLIVEQLEKPGNLGAILRTCDAVSVDGIIVCSSKTDIFNPNVIRASLGTVFSVQVIVATNEQTFEFLKKQKIHTFAASPNGKKIYSEADFKQPLAVVVGSEQEGLSRWWLERADEQIRIPMRGRADSLNVSVSSAVLLYEALRQREMK